MVQRSITEEKIVCEIEVRDREEKGERREQQ